MKFGHVGFTGSQGDLNRIVEVLLWLGDNHYPTSNDDKNDFLDLNRGRDFLTEDKEYEVLVLHFIFRGGITNQLRSEKAYTISPLNSWSNWRKKLINTKARFIFVFGGPVEISGTYICNLDGYKIHKIRTETFENMSSGDRQHGLWIFEKI